MSKFDSIIFDLDGTLWDTCPSCAIGWNNVLRRNQIPFREITADDIRSVTGLPHEDCIRKIFQGFDEQSIKLLSDETSVEDIRVIDERGGELYLGVEHGIRKLAEKFPLFIVSNCQDGYIETFLNFSKLTNEFKDHECWGRTRSSKAANIASIIERNALKNPIYVGDTEGDGRAARECGIPFAFVDYGFGKTDEFTAKFSDFASFCSWISEYRV